MKLVIKVGGSLCMNASGPKAAYFKKLVPVLKAIARRNQVIISIGGGAFVRNYYKTAKKAGLSREQMEWLAVDLLKANVRFVSFLLHKKPIFSLSELNAKSGGVIGGIKPDRSTDANAAHAAAVIGADYFIKMTNVSGIYDKDPKKHRNAKKLNRISFSDLKKYAVKGEPGSYGVLDELAIGIITKNRIKTIVMSGKDPKNLLRALKGERIGTIIS